MSTKVTIKDIESVKDEGNNAFRTENYYKAIMFYEEGLRRCRDYGKLFDGQMPYKQEIGENPKL